MVNKAVWQDLWRGGGLELGDYDTVL